MYSRLKSHIRNHTLLGEVHVSVRSNSKRLIARWKDGTLHLSVPVGVSAQAIEAALDDMAQRLLEIKPKQHKFLPGWTFATPEYNFRVERGQLPVRMQRKVDHELKTVTFYIPAMVADTGDDQFDAFVETSLKEYASVYGWQLLYPLATEMSHDLKVNPASIGISHGHKIMGRCTSRGDIYLSKYLVFYPEELRRYTIAHEFAHLTHMNHSEAFHRLLNRYLNGEESRLYKAFRAFRTPF